MTNATPPTADVPPTNSPVPIRLGGRDYLMRAATLGDVAEFEAWMRGAIINNAIAAAAAVKGEDRAVILQRATDLAATLSMQTPAAVRLMSSNEGQARLLWYSLRTDAPTLTVEDVIKLLADAEAAKTLNDGLDAVNAIDAARAGPTPKKAEAADPAAATSTAPSDTLSDGGPATSTS